MNGKHTVFVLGVTAVAIGAGAPALLPIAPAAIQSNATLQPIGSFLINNGNTIALAGLALILLSVVL